MLQESIIPSIRQETRTVKIAFELKKDLQDDEVICEHCHGTGLEIADNVYGIRGDVTHIGVHFPYKKKSLSFCKRCHNGVQHKCPGCGRLREKNQVDCPCGYDRKERLKKWEDDAQEVWEKASKIQVAEAFEHLECLYVDILDRYVFDHDDLERAINDYDDAFDSNASTLRIYGTVKQHISLDADSIIEDACSDLHEDAAESCDAKGLQKLLDGWCVEQSNTSTYWPDYSVGVVLDGVERVV